MNEIVMLVLLLALFSAFCGTLFVMHRYYK
jgi:hypothetical protein